MVRLVDYFNKYDRAVKKAADPHMTVNGNPLREDVPEKDKLVSHNMQRLRMDADAWNDPYNGNAYRAIRGMTLKGE